MAQVRLPYAIGLVLLSAFIFWACKIDCTKLPDNRKADLMVLPIRVEAPDACKEEREKLEAQREYIQALEYRINFENCTSTTDSFW